VAFEPGDEAHGDDDGHGHGGDHKAAFHPHAPRFAMNSVMVIIALGALLAAVPYFMASEIDGGWVADMINDSTAAQGIPAVRAAAVAHAAHGAHDATHAVHGSILGMDPHKAMYWISGIVGIIGLGLAAWLHLFRRQDADALRSRLLATPAIAWLPRAMEHKWYVDEVYHALIRAPLWVLSHILHAFDRLIIDMLIVDGIARLPRAVARFMQPLSSGSVQSMAAAMAGGIVLLVFVLLLFMQTGVLP
jgi:NADH-quinone oxidoreductase subunit L